MRTYVKVELPFRMKDRSLLILEMLDKHSEEGSSSPLNGEITAAQLDQLESAANAIKRVLKLARELRKAVQLRDKLLGKGVSVRVEGGLPHLMAKVRDTLLLRFNGLETELADWGFKVSVTTVPNASTGRNDVETEDGLIDSLMNPTEETDPDAKPDTDSDIGIGEEGVNDA